MTFDVARYESLLPEIIADLVYAEIRARAPQKFADLRLDEVKTSSDWRRDFTLDSMDRMAVASACAEFFNVYDSGREDTLLGVANCTRWAEVVALAQREQTRNITFRSSGSTRQAKHFRHHAAWLEEEAAHWANTIRIAGRRRIVAHVPLHHIYGYLWVALLSVASGLPFVRIASESLRAPKLDAGDLLITTPHLLESQIARGMRFDMPDVLAVTSTGRFSTHTAQSASDALGLAALWEIYGSSETAGLGIRRTPDDAYRWLPYLQPEISADRSVASVLRALDGTHLRLPLPDRVEGVDDVRFRLGARTDDVVKIRGHRIDLTELRERLKSAPGIADANVRRARNDAAVDAEETIKVFLVAKDIDAPHKTLIADTQAWLAANWQHAGYITSWRVGDVVPMNAIGKLADW